MDIKNMQKMYEEYLRKKPQKINNDVPSSVVLEGTKTKKKSTITWYWKG